MNAKLHADMLRAVIKAAEQGATAKEIADYLENAAKGMRINAAFALRGADLVAALKVELDNV